MTAGARRTRAAFPGPAPVRALGVEFWPSGATVSPGIAPVEIRVRYVRVLGVALYPETFVGVATLAPTAAGDALDGQLTGVRRVPAEPWRRAAYWAAWWAFHRWWCLASWHLWHKRRSPA